MITSPMDQLLNDLGLKDYSELLDYITENPSDPIAVQLYAIFFAHLKLNNISVGE